MYYFALYRYLRYIIFKPNFISTKLVHNQPNYIHSDSITQLVTFRKWIRNARVAKRHNYRVGMTCNKTFDMKKLSKRLHIECTKCNILSTLLFFVRLHFKWQKEKAVTNGKSCLKGYIFFVFIYSELGEFVAFCN